jgi:hypothetical protein
MCVCVCVCVCVHNSSTYFIKLLWLECNNACKEVLRPEYDTKCFHKISDNHIIIIIIIFSMIFIIRIKKEGISSLAH